MPYSHTVLPRPHGRLLIAAVVAALAILPMLVIVPVAAVPGPGFLGPTYGSQADEPSQDKPQSKVWFNDGIWWAGMYNASTSAYHIYRLNGTAWAATSTQVDVRDDSHGDYLWDGTNLWVVSANGDGDADPILLFKYSYDAGTDTYTPVFAGIQVGIGPTESVTIARAADGQLWVTFTNPVNPAGDLDLEPRKVMVNHSTANDGTTWQSATGFQITAGATPVQTGPDDIAAIVAFGSSVGVMWTNQATVPMQFLFSAHANGALGTTWGAAEVAASGAADFVDDHVNLKATADGRVLAAVKTNAGPEHIQLLVRSGGAWSPYLVVGEGIDATRPQVAIDNTNGEAYVFYTIPVLDDDTAPWSNQRILYKKASLGTFSFPAGNGTELIVDNPNDINNVSTPKNNVTSATGLLAIAASETNSAYYHNLLTIAGGGGPSPTPTPTPPPPPPPGSGGHPFTDISGHLFEGDIAWLYQSGITAGCTANRFCPDNSVTREQMASFLVRALGLPATGSDFFTDDESSVHESDINRLAAAGVAAGCGGGRFCPTQIVTREQMASFLVRGFALATTGTDFFTDDAGSIHQSDINRLAASGITGGCGGTRFCPTGAVTRGQMAAFLHRALT